MASFISASGRLRVEHLGDRARETYLTSLWELQSNKGDEMANVCSTPEQCGKLQRNAAAGAEVSPMGQNEISMLEAGMPQASMGPMMAISSAIGSSQQIGITAQLGRAIEMPNSNAEEAMSPAGGGNLPTPTAPIQGNQRAQEEKLCLLKSLLNPSTVASNAAAHGSGVESALELKLKLCVYCKLENVLSKNAMSGSIFLKNSLHLEHRLLRFVLEFNTIDALQQLVSADFGYLLKILANPAAEVPPNYNVLNFGYKGSFKIRSQNADGTVQLRDLDAGQMVATEKPFYSMDLNAMWASPDERNTDWVTLFENVMIEGVSTKCTVKYFAFDDKIHVLLRYWMELSNHTVGILDTRYHHIFSQPYMVRVHSFHKVNFDNINHSVLPFTLTSLDGDFFSMTLNTLKVEKLIYRTYL